MLKLPSSKYTRRTSLRIKDYDYSCPGAYFLTICTRNKQSFFGSIIYGRMILNALGEIAKNNWLSIPNIFKHITIDEFVIMPNHIHGIIFINEIIDSHKEVQNSEMSFKPTTIGQIIRHFKAKTTYILKTQFPGYQFGFQRSFYDHIIRNEAILTKIREYISNNPIEWHFDLNNPERITNQTYEQKWSWIHHSKLA